ncbi:MAG: dTMP kinase [bacterium]|nr:dTMP kinase [bacterium]
MKYDVSFSVDFKRNTYPGRFIVLEGIDGSGKTTQAKSLAEQLNKKGQKTVYTAEPTDGPIGQLIHKILKGQIKVAKASFQHLFSADRANHEEEIVRSLRNGVNVVCDRYFWSAVAYGILDTHEERDYYLTALSILSFYNRFLAPDVTFYLKVSVGEALRRLSHMHKEKEIYEKKEKLEKISAGYEWLLQKFPKEFIVVDGEKPVEEVTKDIVRRIKNNES